MNCIEFGGHRSEVKVIKGIIDKCGVRGDATLCVVIFMWIVRGFYYLTDSDQLLFLLDVLWHQYTFSCLYRVITGKVCSHIVKHLSSCIAVTTRGHDRQLWSIKTVYYFIPRWRKYLYQYISWTFNSISYQASCCRVVITLGMWSGGRAVLVDRILPWESFCFIRINHETVSKQLFYFYFLYIHLHTTQSSYRVQGHAGKQGVRCWWFESCRR